MLKRGGLVNGMEGGREGKNRKRACLSSPPPLSLAINTHKNLPHTLDVATPLLVSAVIASLDSHGVCVCVCMCVICMCVRYCCGGRRKQQALHHHPKRRGGGKEMEGGGKGSHPPNPASSSLLLQPLNPPLAHLMLGSHHPNRGIGHCV